MLPCPCSLPRYAGGSASAPSLSRPAQASLTLRPIGSLNRLRGLGITISIDDFGTGYSSLGRLRTLPIDEVKIDKSFVQNATHDDRDRALLRSTVELGHALELRVVAEGVEDEETYHLLARTGCDVVQGYYVSKPLPPEEFTAFLDRTTSQPVGELVKIGETGA